jgi:transcriptional regulator with XRE-family HTH domain
MQIGRRIAIARNQVGITQEDLAKASGLSRTSIVLIEQGRQRITIDRLYQVAHALRKEIFNLLPPAQDFFPPLVEEENSFELSSAIKIDKRQLEILKSIIENEGGASVTKPNKKGERNSKNNGNRKPAS